jgi:hypothetical protein
MFRRLTFSRLAFTINQQTNNGVKTMSRSYPIWVNTFNDNYGNAWSKSMGVKNNSTASSSINIGTSANNSYDFVNHHITCIDGQTKKTFRFFVDNELVKTATYDKNKKTMQVSDMESKLKERYFQKWKDEEEQKEAAFRNERYAERLKVNGFRD